MKEVKLLKGILKKRKNITLSVLVLFLITGGISLANNFLNEEYIGSLKEFNQNTEIINTGVVSSKTFALYNNLGLFNQEVTLDIINQGVVLGNNGAGIMQRIFDKTNMNNSIDLNNSMGNIFNNGVVLGNNVSSTTGGTGNGITNYSMAYSDGVINTTIDFLENSGVIKGNAGNKRVDGSVGNGVSVYSRNLGLGTAHGLINQIVNKGIIEGVSEMAQNFSTIGNGISIFSAGFAMNGSNLQLSSILKNINNAGTIRGASIGNGGNAFISEGNGISLLTYASDKTAQLNSTLENINNSGIIMGSSSAISTKTYKNNRYTLGNINELNNSGILIGKTIVEGNITSENNQGKYIIIDIDGNVTNIENGSAGVVDGKTIHNGNIVGNDSSTSALVTGTIYDNYIINGVGTDKGALIVDENTELTNSIINGYNTAVYIESGKTLTATGTTFNGGGLKNDVAVIKGSTGDNVASISGASIINGAVDLQDGNDTLSIANTVQINGELDGGTGNDILNLGETSIAKATPNLNILHNITGFENINTNGNVTLFETVNVTGAENITLESGNLVLRVDPTLTVDGKVTGHALYGNNGTLTSTGGNLVVGLNGLGEGTIISMGGTTITPDTGDSWWKDTDHIKTNSLVLDGKLSADGKDINITVLESIPLEPSIPVPPIDPPVEPEPPINPPVDPPINPEPPVDPPVDPPIVVDSFLYEKLNKVYQSIVSAGEIGNLANTTLLEDKTYNESLGGLLTILDQIYANNPYAYSLKSSRDSLKLLEDNMSYLTIKPKKDEMIVQGKAIYTGVKNDSSASGKNYYGFDTGHRNYKTTTNTVGGLATFEYGLSDDTSLGFVFGGNNQDINFKGSSKIKGNSLYLGTFAKTDIRNFKFMSGVGYQYTSADVDRKASNKYDSFSTGDKYDINSLNAFVEAKYVYSAEQDWTVEPKVRLSYYYIDQDKVNEGYTPGQISMKTDTVNSNTADVEVGVDFVKSLYLNNGKLKNILSLGVINTIGDKSKELNGYILGKEKDGKKFDIQGVELPKTSGKVSYNLELEQTNGMIYTAGVSLEFAKDYNRNVNATVGIGYKF